MNLRQQLKFNARGFLAAAKPSPFLVGLCALAINLVLNILDGEITHAQEHYTNILEALQSGTENVNYLTGVLMENQPSTVQMLLSILLGLMGIMISTGIVIYVICAVRYRKGSFGNLLDGLSVLGRVVWYQVVTSVYIYLWSMLLIVPGIIASYSYRQGLYILLDHPEMSVSECIRASKHMMQGKKKELFVLDLSFFGWTFAESMCLNILSVGIGGYAASLMVLPASVFVRMYMEITFFLYYEHLRGVHYDPRVPAAEPTQN